MSREFKNNMTSRRTLERGVATVEMAVSALTFYSVILFSIGIVLIMNQLSIVTQQVVIGSFNGATDTSVTAPAADELFNPPLETDPVAALDSVNVEADKAVTYKQVNAMAGLAAAADTATIAAGDAIPAGYSKAQAVEIDVSDPKKYQYTLTTIMKIPFLIFMPEITFEAKAGVPPPSIDGETIASCVAKGLKDSGATC